MCSRVIDDSEKINNSEIVDKKMMIRCSKIAGNFCAARTGRMAKFAAALHVLLALPITVWGAGEYEPVNDFTEGFYLISNANTSTGTWYIYNKQISDAFVFATPNITINNLWYVSKESKPADTQLYTTEGAYEKVTEAAKRIYLCHQGNGSNIRSYQTGTSGSKLEHYRMVILTSDIDGAYVMISNKSATYTPAGYCTGNASNGGAAFRMDDARDESTTFEKQLFPGSCDGDYSSWVFTPQTVTSNVAWPEITTSDTPMSVDGANWTTMIKDAGTFEYTFESHLGYLWDEQNYFFPNYSTQGDISFSVSSPLPSGVSVTTNPTTGKLTVIIDSSVTGTVSFTVSITATNSGSVSKTRVLTFTTPISITQLSDITNLGAHYILNRDIDASGFTNSLGAFTGILEGGIKDDGTFYSISNLDKPIFSSVNGGIIRNLVLKDVNINNHEGNTGAIASTATGDSRIYNVGILSGSVGGTNNTGGLIGLLNGSARVINCFSYANITDGTYVGGIVGYNNVATTTTNLKTMVMNCMFYGDITGGTNKAPIYNGTNIGNKDASGVSNFNYFWGDANYVKNQQINTYNCALMAETRFLQRFEFFRHLLNSHRELAAWWATGNTANKDQMMKWVLEPEQIGTSTPYPILKTPGRYRSVTYIDDLQINETAHTGSSNSTGSAMSTLAVTIQMGSGGAQFAPPTGAEITTSSLTLNITDKDPDHFNFNYYKVQLPYYNDVGTKNYNGNRVVTGWKITSITTDGSVASYNSYTTGEDATTNADGEITAAPYNFADRRCTDKDLYSVSGRVFNQGAYWDVPEGVTGITIQPYWAKAAYLADAYVDVVYDQAMSTAYNVPNVGGGQIYTNNQNYSIAGENQKVYTAIGNAASALDKHSGHTVYDYAIVLVGNYHKHDGISTSDAAYFFTIMSADFDHDNEPDYSYILRFNGRTQSHPVRVDFLNIPGLGMAQKSTAGTGTYNFGILQPKGWFESTNTSLFRFTQFEYDAGRDVTDPFIVQGGVFEQWVGGQNTAHKNKINYFHVGGNVWFKEFHRGAHQDKTHTTKHPPVSVTGGDYDEFYLTGLYRGDITNYNDNAECYINGGRFGVVAGAAMEGIGNASTHANGNIVWQIQNADIDEFYGGGLNAAHPVEGNITNVITGGYIKQFCGGPKFGDMNSGKTVITTATGCKFDTYYGAGFGGNSYSRFTPENINNINGDYGESNWNTWLNDNYNQNYNSTYGGVSTTFTTQYIPMSSNTQNVARLLIDFVSFSLATTHSVTSKLTGCTITGNFYGGGSLGKVDGPVTSTLDRCIVQGNAFGAGFSASTPTVEVMNTGGFIKAPYFDKNLGVYMDPTFPATVTYTWEHSNTEVNSDATAIDKINHILYTNLDLDKSNLGSVAGNVTLTIKGNSKIGTEGDTTGKKGNVFGGGEQSYVTGSTSTVTVNLQGNTEVLGNVFGGGDHGVVEGSTQVNIED